VPPAFGVPTEQLYTFDVDGVAGMPGLASAQFIPSAAPEPVHAPEAQPAQLTHFPLLHWLLAVHQQGVPAAPHVPVDDETLSQLPVEHENVAPVALSGWQLAASPLPDPVHVPVHWLAELMHFPLEHWLSAVHRHAVLPELGVPTEQEYAVPVVQATEEGAVSHQSLLLFPALLQVPEQLLLPL
jgi:hypothetical protein